MATRRQHIRNSRSALEAGTPLEAEYPFDQTLKALRIGDGATQGGLLQKRWGYAYPVSPPLITVNQNNYSPADLAIAEALFLAADAKRSITGLAAGSEGRRLTLINRGDFDITLVSGSTSSNAANRFLLETDVVLRPRGAIDLQYSVADNRWMRAGGNQKLSTISEELLLTGSISPPQITSNQNDYAPTNVALASTLRLSSDASRNITGLIDPRDGSEKTIINVGTNPIVLKNADGGSSAANRFDFAADVTLSGKQSARIRYDGADAKWKLLSSTAGASVASGGVIAQSLAASALGMSMINGTIVTSVAGGALTISLKTLAGADPSAADPVLVVFRNASADLSDFTVMSITAAASIVVSSGSSLGVSGASKSFRIWLIGFNDGGVFQLGVINCRAGLTVFPLKSHGIASSVAEGGAGAADNAQIFYSASSVSAKPYTTLAHFDWDSGLASPGTWSTRPSLAQLFGPSVALPSTIIQSVFTQAGQTASGSTIIPYDDTIPQISEGDQYLSQQITPRSSTSLLEIDAQLSLTSSASSVIISALFRDSYLDALATVDTNLPASTPMFHRLCYMEPANQSTPLTYKIRSGGHIAGTTTFNGNPTRKYGGTFGSFIRVLEIST